MASLNIEPNSRFEEIESRVLSVALVVAIAVSFADNIWHFLGSSAQDWIFPLILLTLLTFLRWLDVTRRRVVSIAMGAPVRTYDSSSDFYAEASHAVARANKRVYAVFSHDTAPPRQTEESRRYYVGTIRWARKTPGLRSLHRVIRLMHSSPEIQQWVDEQVALTNKVENYHVRVLRYPPGMAVEGENFAVIDSSIVFLGFAADERGEFKGFSVRDERVAQAFEQHFLELWRVSSTPPAPAPTTNSAAPTTPGQQNTSASSP